MVSLLGASAAGPTCNGTANILWLLINVRTPYSARTHRENSNMSIPFIRQSYLDMETQLYKENTRSKVNQPGLAKQLRLVVAVICGTGNTIWHMFAYYFCQTHTYSPFISHTAQKNNHIIWNVDSSAKHTGTFSLLSCDLSMFSW